MECYYHPEREGTDQCAICGKSVCKECGLEIAGKTYCKECLEKIIGLGVEESQEAPQEPVATEPTVAEVINEDIYQPQQEDDSFEIPYATQDEVTYSQRISDDSPYNIKDTIEYSGGLESSYLEGSESIYQQVESEPQQQAAEIPQDIPVQEPQAVQTPEPEYIYPDHSYEPQVTSARQDLEDKYEKYLDDLYFEDNDVPLNEQLAKDEAQYGSLTRREYAPRKEEAVAQQPPAQRKAPKQETPEEMEARIRAEILKEQGLISDVKEEKNIHNLNYQEEKESMGVVDILLTIILIIVILIVIYYLVYLFILNSSYPTFMDAVFALQNPQNVINNILNQ